MGKTLSGVLFCALLMPSLAFAQGVTITGTVVDEDGQPLIGVNVVITDLIIGSATDIEGNYSISVPSSQTNGQTVTLTTSFLGYSPQNRAITLTPGAQTQDFTLSSDVLNLDEVVVTGVTAETPKKKLAFTVDNIGAEKLELAPASNPISSMQGKVAGVTVVPSSGEPGTGVSVRLRGTTSLTGSSEPLYIVDGVILAANQVDIDALDIEGIEIVKGAAASSLYGSRAQNGVVQITTKRGSNIALGQTRVTIRNEFGTNQLASNLVPNYSHNLRVNEQGQFLNADGEVNSCATCLPNGYGPGVLVDQRVNEQSFYDRQYQGELNNAFEEFFNPGNTYTNFVSLSQNNARTNFHGSFTNYQEDGVVLGQKGYNRKSVRLNLDHRAFSNLSVSASAFYSQSERDAPGSAAFNPFFALMFTNPLVSLSDRDPETGELQVRADPLAVEENPLYQIENSDTNLKRSRVLGNFRTRYTPVDWIDLEASGSYDRSDRDGKEFYDRGFQSIDPSNFNDGQIQRNNAVAEALNADVTASMRRTFGALTTRLQLKYQVESFDEFTEEIIGNTLTSVGIADLDNVNGEKTIESFEQTVRSDGFYATTSFDYADKYIADLLFRRDGSSLFGEDERWQSYYRVSAAYRLSEENWWPLQGAIPEFKLRYSLGTAGGRPEFEAQYETFTLNSGSISKGTLGNSELKPELQTEQEFGINFAIGNRFLVDLTYADATVEDLLLEAPLAGYFGFESQWRNAGTLESQTLEASLNASLISGRDFSLDAGIRFDKTEQEITDFNVNAFRGGPQSRFYFRNGEIIGSMYGKRWMTDVGDLAPQGLDGFGGFFDVNDDGYLVAVGQGNTYQDGIAKQLWGTTVDVNGQSFNWGLPITYVDQEGSSFTKIGDVLPDYNLGFDANLRFKGLTAYMLWSAQVGGDVYNFTKQWSYRDGRNADQDQFGKAEGDKKTQQYYGILYDATGSSSHFVEDGTFVKLREVSLGYTFERNQLQRWFGNALNRVGISLIGRNLLTFSDYTGFDPEIGSTSDIAGGTGADASLYRVDNFSYPQFRSYRAKLELQF